MFFHQTNSAYLETHVQFALLNDFYFVLPQNIILPSAPLSRKVSSSFCSTTSPYQDSPNFKARKCFLWLSPFLKKHLNWEGKKSFEISSIILVVGVCLSCWLGRSDLSHAITEAGNSQSRLPFKSSNLKNDDNGKTAVITTTTERERERDWGKSS